MSPPGAKPGSVPLTHQEMVLAQAHGQGGGGLNPQDGRYQSGEVEAEIAHFGLLTGAEASLRPNHQDHLVGAVEVELHAQGPGPRNQRDDPVLGEEARQSFQSDGIGAQDRKFRSPTLLADLLQDLLPSLLARRS